MVALIFPAHEAPGGARTKHEAPSRNALLQVVPVSTSFGRSLNRYGGQDRHARMDIGRKKVEARARTLSGVRKVTVDLDQENLLSSDLVAAMICVMALNLVFLAAGMLLGQVIEY